MNLSKPGKNLHASEIDNSNDYPEGYTVCKTAKKNAKFLTSFNAPQAAFNSMTRESPPVRVRK